MLRSRLVLGLPFVALLGCEQDPQPQLALDGPAKVRVERLGPVDGPQAVLSGGERPEGVVWTVAPESVAQVADGEVRAVGPGEATVTGRWQDQSVQWVLVVEPAVTLRLVDPPARLSVGESTTLKAEGRSGEQRTEPGPLQWSSSDPSIARVSDAGEVTGVAPGVVYITAGGASSDAMVELEVVPAP